MLVLLNLLKGLRRGCAFILTELTARHASPTPQPPSHSLWHSAIMLQQPSML